MFCHNNVLQTSLVAVIRYKISGLFYPMGGIPRQPDRPGSGLVTDGVYRSSRHANMSSFQQYRPQKPALYRLTCSNPDIN
jgi:hypothetical protein